MLATQQDSYPCSPHCAGYLRELEQRKEIERLRAALQRLLDWNEGIAAGRGNHYPREHADVARAGLGIVPQQKTREK